MMNPITPVSGLGLLTGALLALAAAQSHRPQDPISRPAPPAAQISQPPPRAPQAVLPTSLNEADVIEVLRRNVGGVRHCLAQHARFGDGHEGRVQIYLKVRPSGEPFDIFVGPILEESILGDCMKSEIAGWRFPAFSGPVVPVDFPLHVRLPKK